MPSFEIQAYQEMHTSAVIDATSRDEAIRLFQKMVKSGTVHWQPSEEEMELSVDDDDIDLTEADASALVS